MTEARRLVSRVARETVQDITERYEGYHTDLVGTFTQVLSIQQSEPITQPDAVLLNGT